MSPPANDRVPKIGLARTWAVLGILARHLWPKGEIGLRSRVVVALVLLVLAKVANVYVPLLYKHAVDALGEPAAQGRGADRPDPGLWRGARAGAGLRRNPRRHLRAGVAARRSAISPSKSSAISMRCRCASISSARPAA